VASLEHRLQRLEIHVDTSQREAEDAVGREVMRRLTDEELKCYIGALERALEEKFTEEDRPILERVQRLYEEVANEQPTSAS
jgi:hypothetical protein